MKFWVKLLGSDDASSIKLVVNEDEIKDMDVFDLILKLPPLIDVKGRKPSQLHLYAQMPINSFDSYIGDSQKGSLFERDLSTETPNTVLTLIPNRMELSELINKLPPPVASFSFEVYLEDIETGDYSTSQSKVLSNRNTTSSSSCRLNTINGVNSKSYKSSTFPINTAEASVSHTGRIVASVTSPNRSTIKPIDNKTTRVSLMERSSNYGKARSGSHQPDCENSSRVSNGSKKNNSHSEFSHRRINTTSPVSQESSVQLLNNSKAPFKRYGSNGSISKNALSPRCGNSTKSVGLSECLVGVTDPKQHTRNEDDGMCHSRSLSDANVSEIPPLPPLSNHPHNTDEDKCTGKTEAACEALVISSVSVCDAKPPGEGSDSVLVPNSQNRSVSKSKVQPSPKVRPVTRTESATNTTPPPSPFSQQLSREQAASNNISYGPQYRTPSSSGGSIGIIGGKIKPVKEVTLSTTIGPIPTPITTTAKSLPKTAKPSEAGTSQSTKIKVRDESFHNSCNTTLNGKDVASTHKKDICKAACILVDKNACVDFRPLWGKNLCAKCNQPKHIHILLAKRKASQEHSLKGESHEVDVGTKPPTTQNRHYESNSKENNVPVSVMGIPPRANRNKKPLSDSSTERESATASNRVRGSSLTKNPRQKNSVTPIKRAASNNVSNNRRDASGNPSPNVRGNIIGLLNQSRSNSSMKRSATPTHFSRGNDDNIIDHKELIDDGRTNLSKSENELNYAKSPNKTSIIAAPLNGLVTTREEMVKEESDSTSTFISSSKLVSEKITGLQVKSSHITGVGNISDLNNLANISNDKKKFCDVKGSSESYITVIHDNMQQSDLTQFYFQEKIQYTDDGSVVDDLNDPDVLAKGEAAVLAVDELLRAQAVKDQEKRMLDNLNTDSGGHESLNPIALNGSKVGSRSSSIFLQRHCRLLTPDEEEELGKLRSPLTLPEPNAPLNLACGSPLNDTMSGAPAVFPKVKSFIDDDLSCHITENMVSPESLVASCHTPFDTPNMTAENSNCDEGIVLTTSTNDEEKRIRTQTDHQKMSLYNFGTLQTQTLQIQQQQYLLPLLKEDTSSSRQDNTFIDNSAPSVFPCVESVPLVSEVSIDILTGDHPQHHDNTLLSLEIHEGIIQEGGIPTTQFDCVSHTTHMEKQMGVVHETHQESSVTSNDGEQQGVWDKEFDTLTPQETNDILLRDSYTEKEMDQPTNMDKIQCDTNGNCSHLEDSLEALFLSDTKGVETQSVAILERGDTTLDRDVTAKGNLCHNSFSSPSTPHLSYTMPLEKDRSDNDKISPDAVNSLNDNDWDPFSYLNDDANDKDMSESVIHNECTEKDTNKASRDDALIHAVFGTPLAVLPFKGQRVASDCHTSIEESNIISQHPTVQGGTEASVNDGVSQSTNQIPSDSLSKTHHHYLGIPTKYSSVDNNLSVSNPHSSMESSGRIINTESRSISVGNNRSHNNKWVDVINHMSQELDIYSDPPSTRGADLRPHSLLCSVDIFSHDEQHVLKHPIESNLSVDQSTGVSLTDVPKEWEGSGPCPEIFLRSNGKSSCDGDVNKMTHLNEGEKSRCPQPVKISHSVFEEY